MNTQSTAQLYCNKSLKNTHLLPVYGLTESVHIPIDVFGVTIHLNKPRMPVSFPPYSDFCEEYSLNVNDSSVLV